MSDETSEAQVEEPEPDEDVEHVGTEPPPGGDPETADEDAGDDQGDEDEGETGSPAESETAAREVDAGNAAEPPSRPAPKPDGLPRTTTTGDQVVDVRQPGAGAVDEGDALDREREGEDVRGHPEDHGTLLPD